MTMRHSTASDRVTPTPMDTARRMLQVDRDFGVVDACLVVVAVAMVVSDQMILMLQMTYLLLMLGGCYWRFPGFLARSALWVGVATAEMVLAVSLGDTPAS